MAYYKNTSMGSILNCN